MPSNDSNPKVDNATSHGQIIVQIVPFRPIVVGWVNPRVAQEVATLISTSCRNHRLRGFVGISGTMTNDFDLFLNSGAAAEIERAVADMAGDQADVEVEVEVSGVCELCLRHSEEREHCVAWLHLQPIPVVRRPATKQSQRTQGKAVRSRRLKRVDDRATAVAGSKPKGQVDSGTQPDNSAYDGLETSKRISRRNARRSFQKISLAGFTLRELDELEVEISTMRHHIFCIMVFGDINSKPTLKQAQVWLQSQCSMMLDDQSKQDVARALQWLRSECGFKLHWGPEGPECCVGSKFQKGRDIVQFRIRSLGAAQNTIRSSMQLPSELTLTR